MRTKMTMIYWKTNKFWLGKLLEYPEIMTQGETLEELEENMKDAYRLMVLEDVPEVYEMKEIAVWSGQNSSKNWVLTTLETFYTLDFGDFIQELKKQKVTLSKKDEFELLSLFEDQKTQAAALRQEIEKTDKEIDKMVSALYGLTEEEIKIVEEA